MENRVTASRNRRRETSHPAALRAWATFWDCWRNRGTNPRAMASTKLNVGSGRPRR